MTRLPKSSDAKLAVRIAGPATSTSIEQLVDQRLASANSALFIERHARPFQGPESMAGG